MTGGKKSLKYLGPISVILSFRGSARIVRHVCNLLLPLVFLAVSFDVTCPAAFDFFFFPEDVGVGSGLVDHSRDRGPVR